MIEQTTLWGIHMDASVGTDPIDKGYVAIGWSALGNLSRIPNNREAFKKEVLEKIAGAKPGSIPVQAGVLYRFLHEVKEGDLVVYPSKVDRMVNLGRIAGPYRHDPKQNAAYPNMRKVQWLKHLPREDFSQQALYEIGSFITLFSVRNNTEEFLGALEGKKSVAPPDEGEGKQEDAEVARAVALRAEETAQDFVIRQLKSAITPYEFEHFVAHLLKCMGYQTRVTAKSGDGGVDVIAHRDELGFEPPIIKVQCKQVTDPIGRPAVTQLLGNIEAGEHGLFVTLGSYSKDARELDRSKPNLRLIDGEQLVELVFRHYESFEPRYQALLPLKRIYVPAPQEKQF